jgi:sterol desaturase/sphingolipid hydroxylase (fatty acid hydroxylase superfamily)
MKAEEFTIITVLILVAINIIGFVVSLLPIYVRKLDKYLIQNKIPTWPALKKRLPLIFLNITIIMILTGTSLYIFYDMFDGSLEIKPLTIVWQVGLILLIDDFFFYFYHRWMHENKKVLKMVHRIHHRATAPQALDYMYVHPLEWMMGYMGPFVGMLTVAMIAPIHCWAFWTYQLVRVLHEVDIHSGYRSFISKYIPFWGETEHHDEHHAKLNGNYAATFTLWDYVFRTKMKKTAKR